MVVLDISQTVSAPIPHGMSCVVNQKHITKLQTPSEGFFTDGCFVLVEGDYTDDGVLSVIVVGHPPCERRCVAKFVIFPPQSCRIFKYTPQINIWPHRLPGKRRNDFIRRREDIYNQNFHKISSLTKYSKKKQEKYQERLADFESTSFLVLSDLWLDHPRTLEGLRRVLDGCVEHQFIPFAFYFLRELCHPEDRHEHH